MGMSRKRIHTRYHFVYRISFKRVELDARQQLSSSRNRRLASFVLFRAAAYFTEMFHENSRLSSRRNLTATLIFTPV